MINIISKSLISNTVSGPKKVAENLIKGLNKIGYPYVVNQRLDACKRLWIHDDLAALTSAMSLPDDIKIIAGPNIFVLPRTIPSIIDFSKIIYLHPSRWTINFWNYLGFNKGKLDAWPTGIDTDVHFLTREGREKVIVYFKERPIEDLEAIKSILDDKKIEYETVLYGKYNHNEYVKKLATTKYIIWVGRQESQGLALEESLAMNIPILVWDVKFFGQWYTSAKKMNFFTTAENAYPEVTSAYYFDSRCGLITKEERDLPEKIDIMEKDWMTFNPRQYILENLSLEKQARDFVELYTTYYGLSFGAGLKETQLKKGLWKNARWYTIFVIRLKDIVKAFKKYL